jgi:hypothetical protein
MAETSSGRGADDVAKTADEREEDDLFGPQPAAGTGPGAPPPVPPRPPPANNWIPIGPSVVRRGQGATLPSTSGRANGIAVASGGTRVYLAAANGGVWRSDDTGVTWRSLMDAWDVNPVTLSSDSLACASLAIDPANADRIFVGTGDGNEASFFGVGPVVSLDGGNNWTTEPVAPGSPALAGSAMNAIVVDPGNGDRVVAGSFVGVYRREPNPAGGFHWARKTGPAGWITSVVAARAGSTTTFYAAPAAGPVFSSTDGDTWTPVGTGIAIDPADATGNSIYICFGGNGDFRHVWHFDGSQWQARGGPAAGAATSLLDVQHNAVVCDPAHPATVFVGADIGVWRSTDGGVTWAPFSPGLPDAAVLDLDLHHPRRLLRASTYGRSVWEFALDLPTQAGVQLYVRDTQLDQGRGPTVNGLADPTQPGVTVRHWRGPDIKIDTPDATGAYQFPVTAGATIDFEQFTNQLTDDFLNVATHATATIVSRVYVQVHNRGVTHADNVRVMLLLANASAALPNLPAGFAANVQSGTPITTPNWRTVGVATLNDVHVGFPRIAAFDLPSSLLPPPASLAGNDHHCVLALVHHASDAFTATQTVTDLLSQAERKAAHKNLKVVQFTGTLPAPPPVVVAVRLHNPSTRRRIVTTLDVRLNRYRGRVRIYVPSLTLETTFAEAIARGKAGRDVEDFTEWARQQIEGILRNQRSRTPFDAEWSKQRIEDVHAALQSGLMFTAGRKDPVQLRNIVMDPGGRATVFLVFDRPEGAETGTWVPFEIAQLEARSGRVIGGSSGRVEFVKAPKRQQRTAAAVPRTVRRPMAGRAVARRRA